VLYFTSKGRALLFRGGPGVEISRVSYVCVQTADIRNPGSPNSKAQSPKFEIHNRTNNTVLNLKFPVYIIG
jgi:hypothetical protein